jgi:hypothetical protein
LPGNYIILRDVSDKNQQIAVSVNCEITHSAVKDEEEGSNPWLVKMRSVVYYFFLIISQKIP